MSKAILVDAEGDILLDAAGRIQSVTGTEKIVQDLKVLLRSIKGSLPFDTNFGIDDLSRIHNANSKLASSAVQAAIMQHESVGAVKEMSMDKVGRTLHIFLTAILIDGTSIDLGVTL